MHKQQHQIIVGLNTREECLTKLKELRALGVNARITSLTNAQAMLDSEEAEIVIVSPSDRKVCRVCHVDKPKTAFSGRKQYCLECATYSTWSEHKIQVEFFKLLKADSTTKNLPSFTVPNGGKRDIGTALNLEKEGLMDGVWDILGLVPNKKYHGFMIESKTLNGKLSKNQILFDEMVNPSQTPELYATYIMKNPLQGFRWVKEYLCQ